jgi:hypothetical protein
MKAQTGGLHRKFSLPTEQISRATSHFTIGFARLSVVDRVEYAESAGSGTLVTIGGLHGILTAAHVLTNLQDLGKVGIILHGGKPDQFQRQAINLKHVPEPVLLRADAFGQSGPDLGFTTLPREALGWLTAKASFYSLTKRRADVLSNQHPTKSHAEVIVGIVDELTETAPNDDPALRRVLFSTLFGPVRMNALRYLPGRTLNYFKLQGEPDPVFSFPNSFEGVSGGAVWRFYVTEDTDGSIKLADSRLIAVPFFQNHDAEGNRQIVCHGAYDIYGKLVDQVSARWPNETL